MSSKSVTSIESSKSFKSIESSKSLKSHKSHNSLNSLKSKRFLSTLLTFTIVISLFAAIPLTARADSAAKIADEINNYAYFGSGSLTAEVSGNTVTITGTATSGGRTPSLNLDPGVTVIWKADYTSSEINAISINGEGFFELPAGGSLTLTGSGNAITVGNSAVMTITINGGEIQSEGGCIGFGTKGAIVNVSDGVLEARRNALSGQGGVIHVSGGVVSSSEGFAISNIGDGASTTVSGGEVRSVDNVAISSGLDSIVTISGGLVENSDGSNQTISATNFTMTGGEVRNPTVTLDLPGGGSPVIVTGDCDISGGVLSARIGQAIYTNGVNYNINVRGGFTFAYGTGVIGESLAKVESRVLPEGINYPTTVGGSAVVCAWNQAAGHTTYTAGTADDLVVEPSGASAVWGIESGRSGIKYANGANTGFYPLEGVTVVASGTAPTPTPEPTAEPEEQPEPTPTPTAQPGQSSNPWGRASEWAIPELQKAKEFGLIPESLNGSDFTQPITRAEFAAVSVKVYESLSGQTATPANQNPFTDTTDVEVLKAFNVGITAGTSATTFEPALLLNREQAATMLARVYKRTTFEGWTLATDENFPLPYTRQAPFADDDLISDWARDSVYFMASKNIINGLGNNTFGPRNTTSEEEAMNYASATREQALLIATRMVENLGNAPTSGV
ncbi:MAG: S-layer homology domain-containing protein [Oscillospiraceae bacterium]|nr:S-layer homology domain-containing protein [Oscillospiraceae bacterium]